MFKFIWRMGCLSVIVVIAFIIFALLKGGEPLRELAQRSGSLISKSAERLAEKADEIKQTKDDFVKEIKKWTDKTIP